MANLVEQKWLAFKRDVLDPTTPTPEAADGLKLCFFAGMAAYFQLIGEISSLTPEERRPALTGILDEIAQYVTALTRGASPGAPAPGGSADLHNQPPANPLA